MSDTSNSEPTVDDSETDNQLVDSSSDEKLKAQYREEITAQEPSAEERERLINQHSGHLVRRTTSQVSQSDEINGVVQVDRTANVPDMWCFTCDEWVGLSGVELTGRPRSRTEAFYLDGKPETVAKAEQEVRDTLAELVKSVGSSVSHVDDAVDALEFVEAEVSKAKKRVKERDQQNNQDQD